MILKSYVFFVLFFHSTKDIKVAGNNIFLFPLHEYNQALNDCVYKKEGNLSSTHLVTYRRRKTYNLVLFQIRVNRSAMCAYDYFISLLLLVSVLLIRQVWFNLVKLLKGSLGQVSLNRIGRLVYLDRSYPKLELFEWLRKFIIQQFKEIRNLRKNIKRLFTKQNSRKNQNEKKCFSKRTFF